MTARTGIALAAAVLVLTGCSGDHGRTSGPAGTGGHGGAATETGGGAHSSDGSPLPQVTPNQVKALVGRWVGRGPAKDYFVFKADGTAAWMTRRGTLWQGQVIPDGASRFRFSWAGEDPAEASYWGVTIQSGGKSLVFGGTNQTYTKATR